MSLSVASWTNAKCRKVVVGPPLQYTGPADQHFSANKPADNARFPGYEAHCCLRHIPCLGWGAVAASRPKRWEGYNARTGESF